VVHAALSPQVEDLSGNYFENSKAVEPIKLVRNRDTQKKLWEKSCQLLDISQFGGLQPKAQAGCKVAASRASTVEHSEIKL
jgi:hypothetical protein